MTCIPFARQRLGKCIPATHVYGTIGFLLLGNDSVNSFKRTNNNRSVVLFGSVLRPLLGSSQRANGLAGGNPNRYARNNRRVVFSVSGPCRESIGISVVEKIFGRGAQGT
jgi:hypothetical protein